ncbi:hypothetical protein QL285_078298 [Trifolium repens]|nr:hypothetical protein QL285_078298 [Trifolium repens]
MADESKPPDELKPDVDKPKIDKPDVDSKPSNAQPEEEVVDINNHFATNKKYKDQDLLINWVCDEVEKLEFTIVIVKSDYDSFGRKQYFMLGCEKGGAYKSTNKKSKFDKL